MKVSFDKFVKRVNLVEMRGIRLKQFIRKYEPDIQELLEKRGKGISIQEGEPIPRDKARSIQVDILFEVQLKKMQSRGTEIKSTLDEKKR